MTGNVITKRSLGKTGIQVTPIGLGTMEFSGGGGLIGHMFPVIPQEQKNAIVKAALDAGINWFDTAEMYGGGVSERSLATALQAAGAADADVVVATKWLPIFRTAANIPATIGNRQRFLDGYSIGLYMIHQPWSFSSPESEMKAMAGLVAVGKIGSVGISNFNAGRMSRAAKELADQGVPLAANQMHFSLLHRDIETNGVLDTARELGITIIAYTPLERGLLTGKYHKDPQLLAQQPWLRRSSLARSLEATRPLVAALTEIAARHQATPAQVALNWTVNFHGDAVVAIPGATKVYQAQESAGAMAFRLSNDEIAQLDELSRGKR